MIRAHEIRQKIAQIAAGKLSLDAFEDWFVENSWNAHKDSSPEAIDLVASVHLLFSERDDRLLDKAALRLGLFSLLDVVHASVELREVAMPSSVTRWSSQSSQLVLRSAEF